MKSKSEVIMEGYRIACKYGVYENKAFELAEEMYAAMTGQPISTVETGGTFINRKTEEEYALVGHALNCTNAQDGQQMVLYLQNHQLFVREFVEFMQKFTFKE